MHGRNLVVECRVFASRYAIRANVQQCARLKKRRTTPSDRATCMQAGRMRDVRHDLCNTSAMHHKKVYRVPETQY